MALPAAPGSPATPSTMPMVGQGGAPGAPPMGGAGGATMPTPNRGHQAAGAAMVQQAVRLLEKSLSMLGAESEPGIAVMKSITNLAKHIPPGSTSPGVEQSALQKMMQEQKAQQPMTPGAAPPPSPPAM